MSNGMKTLKKDQKNLMDILDIIDNRVRNDINDKEGLLFWINEAKDYGRSVLDGIEAFSQEFDSLRIELDRRIKNEFDIQNELYLKKDENSALQVIIEGLQKKIDELTDKMTISDYRLCEDLCKTKLYSDYWDKLSENSQKFLVTARYISKHIDDAGQDFSPAVIELCRTVENELSEKIYNGFMIKMRLSKTINSEKEDFLAKEVAKFKDRGNYFLSLSVMFASFGYMNRKHGYYGELKEYLNDNNWDPDKLSNKAFLERGDDYSKNYRGKAAHPNIISDKECQKCDEQTKKILKEFFNSTKRRQL